MKEAEEALTRVMNLETFLVPFEFPEDWCFHGPIPFDLKIEDGLAIAKVIALTQEEAEEKVLNYFDEAAAYWEENWEFTPEDEDDEDEDDDVEDAE